MASQSQIAIIARSILENTAIVDEHLAGNSLPEPSFEADGPSAIPISPSNELVAAAQEAVVADTLKLHNLMKGPTEMLMGIAAINANDVLGLQSVQRLNLARAFPVGSQMTYSELSEFCGVNETDLARLMRHAMSNHIFEEKDGHVQHTAASRALAENGLLNDMVGILTNEMFPGASRTLDAIQKYEGAHAPNQSGFSLGHNTEKGLYDELRQYPERGRRFAGAMSGFAARTTVDPIANGFDWASVRKAVDVGGGWGPVSIGLAQRFEHLQFVVQDFADVIRYGPEKVPEDLKERIMFEARDMFDGQDVDDADVFLLRHVLHNFPDEYCSKILRLQLPKLKQNGHIIVFDAVIPEPRNNLSPHKEKFRRSMDLIMMTLFGARERTLTDWKDIVRAADRQLELTYKPAPDGEPPCNLMDIHWK